jgi:acyl-CoA synthetase (AMP-forming)/AMP-acid ligase II
MLLFDWLRADAKTHPDKPAAIFCGDSGVAGEDRISFAELDRRSDAIAAFLTARGVGRGDRVAILCDNTLPALCWFWGVLKAGASTVDVPGLAGRDTIQSVLDEAAPKAIAVDPAPCNKHCVGESALSLPSVVLTTDAVAESLAAEGREVVTLSSILSGDAPASAPTGGGVQPDDPALIVYTSGTTGRPNGVMLSHRNFSSNLEAGNEMMGLTHEDSILVVVPLHYIHGRMQLLWHAMIGGTLVFSAGFAFPQKVLLELIEHETTGFSGVPFHFKQLMDRSKMSKTPPEKLRYVLITGGALPIEELQRLDGMLPNTGIHIAYGQTEASPRITYIGPDELFVKAVDGKFSVGKKLPGTTLEILGSDEQPVGPGQIGEVAAGGPNIMVGYVSGDHRELGKIDAQGRLRTGDLAYLDDDGHLFLAGRSSEMIKSAGERIFPQEIEAVLAKHPRVDEVAVIGIKDPTLGEKIAAYVHLTEGEPLEASDLKALCLESLPFVRVPKVFVIRDEPLPKTGSGKVSRGKLRKEAADNPPT